MSDDLSHAAQESFRNIGLSENEVVVCGALLKSGRTLSQ